MDYKFQYCSVGGVIRVKISSGEDIAHLGELDPKLWTALSCPVQDLQFDSTTLRILDSDSDGKIRIPEVVSAAQWLTSIIKDKDLILEGSDVLPLDSIDTSSEEGKRIYDSAKQILANLGRDMNSITLADACDSAAIFSGTKFNGDGVIIPASADDQQLKETIELILANSTPVADRSGENGIDAPAIESFYSSLADYRAWMSAAEADKENIFPYGDDTPAALSALEAVKDKVNDYFMRCSLIAFDGDAAPVLDIPMDKLASISGENLSLNSDKIAVYPIARPSSDGILSYNAINPAWKAAFQSFKTLVLDKEYPGADGINLGQWEECIGRFTAYSAWKASEKGSQLGALGIDKIDALLSNSSKEALLELVAKDNELAKEAESIDSVNRLMHLYRYFYKFLSNFVLFSDFYARNDSIFEIGKLYIDQRCCDLCVKVSDMGKHSDMASLSGMFLIYCKCVCKTKPASMDIVAVMTSGNVYNLRPGTNAVFYDREGLDWDATVTKIVDNPISIRQAFWTPYRKLADFINNKIDKSAKEKDSKAISLLQSKADNPQAITQQPPFDIAKFAGIFAALGMAVGAIGVALSSIFKGLFALKWWQVILVIVVILLIISGPACFIAWRKLRKRNLGPVLNANGWAINSNVLVNILFGKTLTSVAKYPHVKLDDPFSMKVPLWKRILRWVIFIAVALFAVLYFTDNAGFLGIERQKKAPVEEVTAAPAPADAAVVSE